MQGSNIFSYPMPYGKKQHMSDIRMGSVIYDIEILQLCLIYLSLYFMNAMQICIYTKQLFYKEKKRYIYVSLDDVRNI